MLRSQQWRRPSISSGVTGKADTRILSRQSLVAHSPTSPCDLFFLLPSPTAAQGHNWATCIRLGTSAPSCVLLAEIPPLGQSGPHGGSCSVLSCPSSTRPSDLIKTTKQTLKTKLLPFLGRYSPWHASYFTASDDRVRGGKSQSYLTVLVGPDSATTTTTAAPAPAPATGSGSSSRAEFAGHLDIKTLGGAGFASQRTVDDLPAWDLSAFDTLVLDVARADGKKYTVTLKDETLPKRPDGREQSTVSWEYDFIPTSGGARRASGPVAIPFAAFQPTYRGRPKPDAKPLDLKDIKRISFMMRRCVDPRTGPTAPS